MWYRHRTTEFFYSRLEFGFGLSAKSGFPAQAAMVFVILLKVAGAGVEPLVHQERFFGVCYALEAGGTLQEFLADVCGAARLGCFKFLAGGKAGRLQVRSEEHTSELQSL